MTSPDVRTMTAAEERLAIDTIVLAFAADPMARWSWPDAHQYLEGMAKLARASGATLFIMKERTARMATRAPRYGWRLVSIPTRKRSRRLVATTVTGAIRDEMAAVFERMAKHHPVEPHWYLPLIGVDPVYWGKGHGDALMAYALQRCDRDHLPAYLESTNPRNISLYKRHGFEALGTIRRVLAIVGADAAMRALGHVGA